MEKMERETRETLGKYLSALDEKSSEGDTTHMLLEKIEELRKAEALVEEKEGQIVVLQTKLTESLTKQEDYLIEKKIHAYCFGNLVTSNKGRKCQ
jgi:nucleosome binding factor SPN SPT16 subunit